MGHSEPANAPLGARNIPGRRPTRHEQLLGVAALVFLLIGGFVVLKPFLTSVMWAVVLGFSLWPVQRRLTQWVGGRRTIAALITTLTITLVLVVPFVVIGFSIADDARALGIATRKWIEAGPPAPPVWLDRIPIVGDEAKAYWKEFAEDSARLLHQLKQAAEEEAATNVVSTVTAPPPGDAAPVKVATEASSLEQSRLVRMLKSTISTARNGLVKAGLAIGRGVLEVALSVFLAFFIFRDGAEVADRLTTGVARIAGERGKHLLEVAGNTVRGVVYGILGTALVQGVMAGIGFLIAGVPGATLLALLTFFLSPVPMGPPLVWIPAVLWLFNQGFVGWGIFMLIWGLGVSSIDNLVRPWLISQGSNMPFILIFFGVIGGAIAFGLIGVFLGPTLLAVAFRLIEEWSRVSEGGSPDVDPAAREMSGAADAGIPGP